MSKQTFTPGPWKLYHVFRGDVFIKTKKWVATFRNKEDLDMFQEVFEKKFPKAYEFQAISEVEQTQ